MARLNIQERIFIVETMTLTKSATTTGRKFNAKFGHRVTLKTIMRIIKNGKNLVQFMIATRVIQVGKNRYAV